MSWIGWLQIAALFIAGCALVIAALLGFLWLLSKPLGDGPDRVVDVENRGHTVFVTRDGKIK
jgi:hypothetical protein